jgi:hypothetical protein
MLHTKTKWAGVKSWRAADADKPISLAVAEVEVLCKTNVEAAL